MIATSLDLFQHRLARVALGCLDAKDGRPCRNKYVAFSWFPAERAEWDAMVAAGIAERTSPDCPHVAVYRLTEAGLAMAMNDGEIAPPSSCGREPERRE